MPATRHLCPLPACGWHHDDAGLTASDTRGITPDATAVDVCEVTASFVRQAMLRHATRINALVEAHVTTHPVLDWLREINRLQAALHRLGYDPASLAPYSEHPC